MKTNRILSAIVASAILASCTGIIPMNTYAAENAEVFNDSFETSFDGWGARGDASLEIVEGISHTGDSSLFISGRTVAWHGAGCSKILELQAGKTYDLSAWVMYETGNSNEQINLKILYKDTNGQENYKDIASVNASKGKWSNITKTSYTVPSGSTNVTLYFETPSNLIDFYVDDVSAYGEPVDYSNLTEGFKEDFENGTAGWSGRGSATAKIVTDESYSGKSSLYTSGRTQIWNGAAANKTMSMFAGHYYRFGGWVMYKGDEYTDTQKFSVNLQYQQDGQEKYYTAGTVVATKGEWAYVEAEYILPADASNFSVYFQTAWKPDASVGKQDLMDFYLDDAFAEVLPAPEIQEDIASLKDVYKDYFKLGCAAANTELAPDVTKDLIRKQYNSFTLGNELKPDSVLDRDATVAYMNSNAGDQTNPQITLKNAVDQLDFARDNNIPVRGHVLVWHSQTPDWFFKENYDPQGNWVSVEIMNQRLENYIKNIMETLETKYPTVEFYAWDVVNEAFTDTGIMRTAGSNNIVSGQSAWVSVYGDDSFINKAFEYARKYAPENCKLFYNDYNEYVPAKRDAIIAKTEEIKAEGNIDGIGMQSHIKLSYPSIDLYKEAVQKFGDTGLEVQITELDVDVKSNNKEDQLQLAERYRSVFEMYKEMKDSGVNLTAVVLWGITDSTSWIGGYPLLFDKNYQAKPAFYAVADTDAEVQQINTTNAINNTDTNQNKAFEVQKYNWFASNNSFKAIWDSNTITINVVSKLTQDITVYCDGEQITKSMNAGSNQDFVFERTNTVGDSIDFDIATPLTAWNDLSYSSENPIIENYGKLVLSEMPLYTEAVKGTPILDGIADEAWNNANTIDVETYTLGTDGATATVKTLWDENYIYVLADVTDSNLNKSNANAYEQDTVEVFFDENNNKTAFYQSDDIQCRINYDNEKTVTDGRSTDDFLSSTTLTDKGYIVEVAIPYSIDKLYANQIVGFDAQVNDAGGDGARTGIANWSDLTGMGYTSTSGYGVMKLVDTSTPSEILLGDITCDGKVNTADLVMLSKYLVSSVNPTAQGLKNVDVTKDSKVTTADLVMLAKFLVGEITLD